MTDDSDGDNVGYGCPPKRHRFKKGKSGNPKGRPPKRKQPFLAEFAKALNAELSRKISIKGEDGKVSRIGRMQALARKICFEFLKKPDVRELQTLLNIIERGENDDFKLTDQPIKIVVEGAAEQILLHEMEIPRSEGERWMKRLNKEGS